MYSYKDVNRIRNKLLETRCKSVSKVFKLKSDLFREISLLELNVPGSVSTYNTQFTSHCNLLLADWAFKIYPKMLSNYNRARSSVYSRPRTLKQRIAL